MAVIFGEYDIKLDFVCSGNSVFITDRRLNLSSSLPYL